MDYISTKEAAKRWNISERRVRTLCSDGRIEGAARHGDWAWSIPATTQRPIDGRAIRFQKNNSFRIGVQNYTLCEQAKTKIKTDEEKNEALVNTIALIMSFEDIKANSKTINKVLKGFYCNSISLYEHVQILNIQSTLSSIESSMDDYTVRNINKSILTSVDNKERGQFKDLKEQQLFTTLMLQYRNDWSALHPVARATFLLGELLRIQCFTKANASTAICAFQMSLMQAGYPLANIKEEDFDELKASLAATGKRGNYQSLISMVTNALL